MALVDPLLPVTTNSDVILRKSQSLSSQQRKKRTPRSSVTAFRRKQYFDAVKTPIGRVGVHSPVDSIDIEALGEYILLSSGLDGWESMNFYDAMRVFQKKEKNEGDENNTAIIENNTALEVFIFSFGSIVFWNFPNEDAEETWIEQHILTVDEACGDPQPAAAVVNATDEIEFCYGEEFKFRDSLYLGSNEPGEKLSISFGMAKSSLLSIFEWKLEKAIGRNSHVPIMMAETGRIGMSRKDISKEVGRIYLLNQEINLEYSIHDTPEELWEDSKFEEQYDESMKYFDIDGRMELLNDRVEILQDWNTILSEAATNVHGVKLEKIIIWLILVEVVIEVLRYYRD